jgi:hypothetical protein
MSQLAIPRGWNKRVQSAILQAISLGRHCFFLIVGRLARSRAVRHDIRDFFARDLAIIPEGGPDVKFRP